MKFMQIPFWPIPRNVRLGLFYLAFIVASRRYAINTFELVSGRVPDPSVLSLHVLSPFALIFDNEYWFRERADFVFSYPDSERRISLMDFERIVGNYQRFEFFQHWFLGEAIPYLAGLRYYFCDATVIKEKLPGLNLAVPLSVSVQFKVPDGVRTAFGQNAECGKQ